MLITRKESIARRKKLLEELYLLHKAEQKINLIPLCKEYGVSSLVIKVLEDMGIIEISREKRRGYNVTWSYPLGEPTEKLAVEVFETEQRQRGKKVLKNEEPPKNGIILSEVIDLTAMGIRYGIQGKNLESFVKEGLNKFNKK